MINIESIQINWTKPPNRTYIPVSRVASAKLGSGWFTRTTKEKMYYVRPGRFISLGAGLENSLIASKENHSHSHATSVMSSTATTLTEASKPETRVSSTEMFKLRKRALPVKDVAFTLYECEFPWLWLFQFSRPDVPGFNDYSQQGVVLCSHRNAPPTWC